MTKIQSARELFLNTLNKMGIKYEIDEDNGKTIWFDYLYMEMLFAEEDKDSRYINLEYIDLKELNDGEDVKRMQRIINKVSAISNVVIASRIKRTHYRRKILFIKEIPNIENYLRTEIQELIRTYEMVNSELQEELKKEGKIIFKRDPLDKDSTQTRDLFIKTITDMDCPYETWEDEESSLECIVFDFQGTKYRAKFLEYSREVLIENHYNLYSVELSDANKVNQLRDVINKVNLDYNIPTTYYINNESGKMEADASCVIPFMEEMPQLIHYLHDALDQLSDVEFFIKDEMEEMARAEEIEKMGYLNQEPN